MSFGREWLVTIVLAVIANLLTPWVKTELAKWSGGWSSRWVTRRIRKLNAELSRVEELRTSIRALVMYAVQSFAVILGTFVLGVILAAIMAFGYDSGGGTKWLTRTLQSASIAAFLIGTLQAESTVVLLLRLRNCPKYRAGVRKAISRLSGGTIQKETVDPSVFARHIRGHREQLGVAFDECGRNENHTILLFPFVVFDDYMDTAIWITNCTADPYGSSPDWGQFTIYFYQGGSEPVQGGSEPVAVQTGPFLHAGESSRFTMKFPLDCFSSSFPTRLSGYAVVHCCFPRAHGLATVLYTNQTFTSYAAVVLSEAESSIDVPSSPSSTSSVTAARTPDS